VMLGLVLAFTLLAWTASPAMATTVTGRGVGYLSSADGGFWLGSWQLDDGRLAFCVNTERSTPNGGEYTPDDGAGWYSPDDAAKLAYISRTWASSADRATAAAGQIATWSVTGLGRHSIDQYAAMAGADATTVRQLALAIMDETAARASRGVSATLALVTTADGPTVTADLVVDRLSTGSSLVDAGSHLGTVTLAGATFEDGSTSKQVPNGVATPIVLTGANAVQTASATVSFEALPYGSSLAMGESTSGAQNLLVAAPATATASASLQTTMPSRLPFQPVVSTQTSAAEAAPGATVHDLLTIDVQRGPGLSSEWGVHGPDGGPFAPVPVTVRSTLLGPFAEPVAEADAPPLDAPVVCEVELVVSAGPGQYATPECVLPSHGFFVWVERIEPSDTPADLGGELILPWTSRFGVASEVTYAPRPEAPAEQPPIPSAPRLPETGIPVSAAPSALASLIATGLGVAALILSSRRRGRTRTHVRADAA